MATISIAARAGVLALSTGTTASSTDVLAELRNIRIRLTHGQIDASSNDSSGWDEFIRGNRGWTFTADWLYATSSGMASRVFADAIINDYAVAARFFPTTATYTHNYAGTAHITDFELAGDTNGLFVNSLSGQGTGAITYTTST